MAAQALVRISAAVLLFFDVPASFAVHQQFCKCVCGTSSAIVALAVPGQTCLNCNKAFCLARVCADKDDSGSNLIEAVCFERESFKDWFLVTTFLIVTSVLVAGVFCKDRVAARWKKVRMQRNTFGSLPT